jgi:N-acetylneuraminic acid mutarotase
MPMPLAGLSLISSGGKLVAAGGEGIHKIHNQTYEISDAWEWISAMTVDRCYAALVSVKDSLYVFGGKGHFGSISSIERLNLSDPTGEWTILSNPMPEGRERHAAAVFGDSLVVVAGGVLKDGSVTSAVNRYDPSTGEWLTLDSLKTARFDLGLATVNGRIYAIGGRTASESAVGTVEMFVP